MSSSWNKIERVFNPKPGQPRYRTTDTGCGCCSSDHNVSISDAKAEIEELEEELAIARAALADMEQNGERVPNP